MTSKIAIIGNGAINNKHGKFIDSCDTVIRMKQFVTEGYEEHVGTKLDIYVSKWFSWFEAVKPYSSRDMSHVMRAKEFWFMFCDPYINHATDNNYAQKYLKYSLVSDTPKKDCTLSQHEHLISKFNLCKDKIKYYPIQYIEELAGILNISPTVTIDKYGRSALFEPCVGIRTIHKVVSEYTNENIYIAGFDCFYDSGWYWDSAHKPSPYHSFLSEKVYINSLIKSGKVIEM